MVETAPAVRARHAGMLFQMWHHLGANPASRLLFDTFAVEDRLIGLLDAIIATASRPHGSGARPRLLLQVTEQDRGTLRRTVEPALMVALALALGAIATPEVLEAWRQAFRLLMSA